MKVKMILPALTEAESPPESVLAKVQYQKQEQIPSPDINQIPIKNTLTQ